MYPCLRPSFIVVSNTSIPPPPHRSLQLNESFEGRSDVVLDSATPNDVASVLKYFLRCLPLPLLPSHLVTAFSDVTCTLPLSRPARSLSVTCAFLGRDECLLTAVLETADAQLTALRLLCSLLPPCNRDLLQALLALLSQIAALADEVISMGHKLTAAWQQHDELPQPSAGAGPQRPPGRCDAMPHACALPLHD